MSSQISCRDAGINCDFMVRSEDKDETIKIARKHAKEKHDKSVSRSELRKLVKQK